MQGSPSQVNGVGLRTLSRRRSWVQIPPPAPYINKLLVGPANGDNWLLHVQLDTWTGTGYQTTTTINDGQGYWVFVLTATDITLQ